ncbi:hypothetical protein [Nocardia terpenica]|uniref:hypothetical protein n=1 Tax=Nocardia terpenica TaxID=455432 RepID=UPI0012FD4D3C|nr:hypothetical protein [Nocardia terpenica]
MDTVSGVVELCGALVTAGGLVFAWNRASNRRLRGIAWKGAQEFWENLARSHQIVNVAVPSKDEITLKQESGDVFVQSVQFDDDKPLSEQVAEHLRGIGNDLQQHRIWIEKLLAGQQAQADSARHAIEQAVESVQSRTKRETFCDLRACLTWMIWRVSCSRST